MDLSRLNQLADHRVAYGEYYRFHSRAHFYPDPERFYKNFLDTPRKFRSRERFAGPGFNCGFYLASSELVSASEMLFHSGIDPSQLEDSVPTKGNYRELPTATLRKMQAAGKEYVFLEVLLSMDKLVDFTNPSVLREFLIHGHPAATQVSPIAFVEFLSLLVAEAPGGDTLTNTLGADAHLAGATGVLFPSARALTTTFPNLTGIRLSAETLRTGFYEDDFMGFADQMAEQLKEEHNMVLFSGSAVMRAIREYNWVYPSGHRGSCENLFYDIEAKELESVRLAERNRLHLEYKDAVEQGLLSDSEIAKEFKPNLTYIRS
jgi:hypothetical protein